MTFSKVTAIFDELKLQDVEQALVRHKIQGYTLHPVRGKGRYFDSFNSSGLVKHIQMEIITVGKRAGEIGEIIAEAAYSNTDSEGLVAVEPVSEMRWIHDRRLATADDFEN